MLILVINWKFYYVIIFEQLFSMPKNMIMVYLFFPKLAWGYVIWVKKKEKKNKIKIIFVNNI